MRTGTLRTCEWCWCSFAGQMTESRGMMRVGGRNGLPTMQLLLLPLRQMPPLSRRQRRVWASAWQEQQAAPAAPAVSQPEAPAPSAPAAPSAVEERAFGAAGGSYGRAVYSSSKKWGLSSSFFFLRGRRATRRRRRSGRRGLKKSPKAASAGFVQ